jgi:hypothetical protein
MRTSKSGSSSPDANAENAPGVCIPMSALIEARRTRISPLSSARIESRSSAVWYWGVRGTGVGKTVKRFDNASAELARTGACLLSRRPMSIPRSFSSVLFERRMPRPSAALATIVHEGLSSSPVRNSRALLRCSDVKPIALTAMERS